MNSDLRKELEELLTLSLEKKVSQEQVSKLNAILDEHPDALQHSLDFYSMIACLSQNRQLTEIFINEDSSADDTQISFLEKLAQYEKTALEVEVLQKEPQPELIQDIGYSRRKKKRLSRISKVKLVIKAAAVLFIVLFLKYAPSIGGVEVATLSDSIDAKWVDMDASMHNGTRLVTSNKKLTLQEGVVELTFDNQAKVTIESPAEFKILANDRVYMNYGKAYAIVPKEAIGFSVYTPNAKMIDLGTEFGIHADTHGDTRIHVLKGKISLAAGNDSSRASIEVTKGSAKRISGVTPKISDCPYNERLFVRRINSTDKLIWRGETEIDLADIVGGGNGLKTGRVQNSINPATGEFETWDIPGANSSTGHNQYLPVDDSKFIDGIFVPDGRAGAIQVTSLGDQWQAPATSNRFKYNIVNSLHILENPSQMKYVGGGNFADQMLRRAIKGGLPTKLMGIEAVGFPSNSIDTNLFFHSNLGITFDLDEIRRILPDHRIRQFNSLFGVGEGFLEIDNIAAESISLDVWVLVDGQVKYHKRGVGITTLLDIDIDLVNGDRFLSLVVTDGENENVLYDWGLFVNPRLEVE